MHVVVADVIRRLTSRKFLLTVGAVIGLFGAHQYNEALGVLGAYLGLQGTIDFRKAKTSGSQA